MLRLKPRILYEIGLLSREALVSGLRTEIIFTAEIRVYFVLVFLRVNQLQRDCTGSTILLWIKWAFWNLLHMSLYLSNLFLQ